MLLSNLPSSSGTVCRTARKLRLPFPLQISFRSYSPLLCRAVAIWQGRALEAREAHNLEEDGSIPSLATM